jgi:hypothetical protein
MRAINFLASVVTASALWVCGASAALIDDKNTEISQNIETSERMVAQLVALGECASEDAVLEVIERAADDVDMVALATSLEMVAAAREWCPAVMDTLRAAIDAANTVLAIREREATGAGPEAPAGNNLLRLGGYGPNWGSGGSGYTY